LVISDLCVIKEALSCYETAIQTANEEFSSARDLHKKVEFAEQLADRHFNRALYFLISKNDPCTPDDAEKLGYQDLMKAHALDHDVQGYLIKNKMLLQKSEILYDRMLRRLFGLIALQENGVETTMWDPIELVYDCHRLLSAAWDDFTAPIFHNLDRHGRLQQLEGAMIQLELQRKNYTAAARLAIRMIVEDEFLNETSFQYAADAILQFTTMDEEAGLCWSQLTKTSAQRDIRNMLKSCKHYAFNKRKCLFLCLDLGDLQHTVEDGMEELRKQLLSCYDSNCGKDDFFGLLACNGNNGSMVNMEIECRRQRMGGHHQRAGIETAMLSLCDPPPGGPLSSKELRSSIKSDRHCKPLLNAVDRVIDSEASLVYDSYILFVTDGPKQDWDWKLLLSIKHKIEETNAKRKGDIHIVIFDLETEATGMEESWRESREMCRNLCDVSQGSCYMKASLDNLEDEFDEVRLVISDRKAPTTARNSSLMSGITMEKF
jgi:hypothetical protein